MQTILMAQIMEAKMIRMGLVIEEKAGEVSGD